MPEIDPVNDSQDSLLLGLLREMRDRGIKLRLTIDPRADGVEVSADTEMLRFAVEWWQSELLAWVVILPQHDLALFERVMGPGATRELARKGLT